MDEKTERLRNLFMDITEESTVTERQEQSRGSLTPTEKADERLESVIKEMSERYEFTTTLSVEQLIGVVRGYFDDRSDAEIARDLGDASLGKTVSRARIDLHMLRESDTDAPFDLKGLRKLLDRDASVEKCADELDVSASTIRRYRRIVDAQREKQRVQDRFYEEFENILTDRELSDRLAREIREDGLEDATEGMESNVSF